MTDDTPAYPKPGTAEVGILEFGPASARRAALETTEPAPRPALNPENYTHAITKAVPLSKAASPEYIPTSTERIAAALERIADSLEARRDGN